MPSIPRRPSLFTRCTGPVARRFTRRPLAVVSVVLALAGLNAVVAEPAFAGTTYYLSTAGTDSNPGTSSQPFRTFAKALATLRAGDTLEVRGGTYRERFTGSVSPGDASRPVVVRAAAGERPVIEGLLWMKGADSWTFDGINVTWSTANNSGEHMVKFRDMRNWRLTNAEIWGAHSYAAILVSGATTGWSIDHSYVHDTYASNGTNQDHLIYVNTTAQGGVIERNVLANSANGRGVKVGPSSSSTTPIGGVTIRYNTMYNNTGPSNVQLSYGASNNVVYRNLMQRPSSGETNVTGYNLNGSGNRAYDNAGWDSAGVMRSSAGIADGGGNVMVDPRFAGAATGDFTPTNAAAQGYGHLAAGDASPTTSTTAPTTTTTGPSTTTTTTGTSTTTTTSPTTTTTTGPSTTTTTIPTPPATSPVTFVGASSGTNTTARSVTLARPAGVVAGDAMVASVDARGSSRVTPPSGWQLVRTDAIDTVSVKATYVKIASGAEPASYAFGLSRQKSAVGLLVAFRGVDRTSPVMASSGVTSSPANWVLARSVTTSADGVVVLGLFQIDNVNTIEPPAGSFELAESSTASSSATNVTGEVSYFVQGAAGETGDQVARAASTAANIGQLVALRAG